jgi:1-acyl-sn-glycerol-3-phosphate acyltransferase
MAPAGSVAIASAGAEACAEIGRDALPITDLVAEPSVPWLLRLARMARVIVHCAYGLAIAALFVPRLSDAARDRARRAWSSQPLRVLRVETRLQGDLDAPGRTLLVGNHVSWLDIVVLHSLRPARFVAKAELAAWPIVGRLMRSEGTLFIDRRRRQDVRRVGLQVGRALESGHTVVVFPEGTTTDGRQVLPFRSALLQPASDVGAILLPIALCYRGPGGLHSTRAPFIGDDAFVSSLWRICGARSLRVDVKVANRIEAGGRRRDDLAREAREAIRQMLGLQDAPNAARHAADA